MKKFILFIILALCLSATLMLTFAGGFSGFSSFLSSANPLLVVALLSLGFSICSFIFGLTTGDYSWVDRLWSTLPVAFVWYYAYRGGFSAVMRITSILVTIWGLRLSFNFARKGGYSGTEDYRWPVLRSRIKNSFLWQLFNLFFISSYQIGLFILFTFPAYSMTTFVVEKIPPFFWSAAILGLVFIAFETLADEQQWKFHAAKKSRGQQKDFTGKYQDDVKRGFFSGGLFSLSRHPNYFGELGFWFCVWLMALSLTGDFLRTGFFGPLALTVLFIGSTIFTESLSAAKYPGYRDYQARVSPIIPWFPGKAQGSENPCPAIKEQDAGQGI